jgi:methyl-accepting chemotaxis protein
MNMLSPDLIIQRDSLLEQERLILHKRADKILLLILALEWVICMIASFILTPQTWNGPDSSTHMHIYLSIVGGGMLTLFPAFMLWKFPGHSSTRISIGIAALLFTTIYTTILGGRQDSHFIVFVNFAFLAMYEDYFVMLAATVTVALDHLLRNIIAPYSVFGTFEPDWATFFHHVMWVILIVAGIILYNEFSKREKKNMAMAHINQLAEIEKNKAYMEARNQMLGSSAKRLLDAMDSFSNGDLSITIDTDEQDELKLIYQGFNHTVQQMRSLINTVQHNVETAMEVAEQLTYQTSQVEQALQMQLAQTQEVSAAAEEMSATITENAHTAIKTSDEARGGQDLADRGEKVTAQTIEKMEQIAEFVANSTSTIEKLGKSSEEIGEIVSVINDIADQTNLLALNAAIEAARAGEQGRGFAVVADEVRKLAERTARSTKQISGMIQSIQQETGRAVAQMHSGNAAVKEGRILASEAGQALQAIARSAGAVQQAMRHIAEATKEQSATSQQIAHSMDMMMNTVRESGSTIQGISTTTRALTSATEQLKNSIRHFRNEKPLSHGAQRAIGRLQKSYSS